MRISKSVVWVVVLAAFVSFVRAQPPASLEVASFEVASIRRNLSGSQNTQIDTTAAGRLTVNNASLKTLIRNAYGVLSFQLAGGTAWLDTEMYDIEAKTGTPEKITQVQLAALLQSLLADRFRLRVHWETRESSVYALVIDKSGPKFKVASGEARPGMNTRKGPEKARITGTAEPMSDLAGNLGNQLGRFVVDKTGLPGSYDFTFEWDLQSTADSTGPSLFTALKEQLGLRLESQKGPVEVLVIDSAERASEN